MLAELLSQTPLEGFDRDAVQAACAYVRSVCSWHIAPVQTMTVPVERGTGTAWLPSLRVVQVNAITWGGQSLPYAWDPDLQELRVTGWPLGCRRAAASITHGFDACPDDLRQAVARLARDGYADRRVRTDTQGPFSTSYFDDTRASDAAIARYALPQVA